MDRRSFLSRVAGGLLIAGAGEAQARPSRRRRPVSRQMLLDADPKDPARPVPSTYQGHGRPRTGITDSDPSDPAGTGPGRPLERFVICPGNARCPRRLP